MRLVTPEDHQYLTERGFSPQGTGIGVGTYQRTINKMTQSLSLVGTRDPTAPMYWTATGVHTDVFAVELCVRYEDHFESPIVAFATAEIRGWKA